MIAFICTGRDGILSCDKKDCVPSVSIYQQERENVSKSGVQGDPVCKMVINHR